VVVRQSLAGRQQSSQPPLAMIIRCCHAYNQQ
jgi:hypothetical protein